ncbi:MAG: hypothetical protein JSU96_14675 [Acidobacteriota bacterium]|nr:MAG: hypothetical protein JSU96_14675 [Acidobacteriota bacterium]
MSEKIHSNPETEHVHHGGHEKTDADVKPIVQFLVGLGALMVFVMFLMTGFYNLLDDYFGRSEQQVSPLVDVQQIPPGPKLQVNPAEELTEVRSWEDERLGTYEWIDEDTGVFRIPIERAKEIVAETGLPHRRFQSAQ